MSSCKELREARKVNWVDTHLAAADMATLGTLGSVLPALCSLSLWEGSGADGPDGAQRLAEGLNAGALPAVSYLDLDIHVGDAGALALAAALGRGALPRLDTLFLMNHTAIGDAGLVALAPALRRLPALVYLHLFGNPFGDEGLIALLAPPPPAGTVPLPTGWLKKLELLELEDTQVSDAGCAALVSALDSGALPALEILELQGIPASAAAIDAVREALAKSRAAALAEAVAGAAATEALLVAMKVPQLKELCQQRSIATKGLKKAELVWSLLSQPPLKPRPCFF